jgi:hypothetical protein
MGQVLIDASKVSSTVFRHKRRGVSAVLEGSFETRAPFHTQAQFEWRGIGQ